MLHYIMLRQCNEENYATCGDSLTKIIIHNFVKFHDCQANAFLLMNIVISDIFIKP